VQYTQYKHSAAGPAKACDPATLAASPQKLNYNGVNALDAATQLWLYFREALLCLRREFRCWLSTIACSCLPPTVRLQVTLINCVDKRVHLQVLICNCGSWACSADTADEPPQGRCKGQGSHVAYYDNHVTLSPPARFASQHEIIASATSSSLRYGWSFCKPYCRGSLQTSNFCVAPGVEGKLLLHVDSPEQRVYCCAV
jgi:hypothetical protein